MATASAAATLAADHLDPRDRKRADMSFPLVVIDAGLCGEIHK